MKKLIFIYLAKNLASTIAIVGLNLPGHGLSQITQGLKYCLEDKYNVTILSSRTTKSKEKFDYAIFTDSLTCFEHDLSKNMPDAKIKYAFCLWETDTLPSKWVDILNNKFDAVIVAAEWYVEQYKKNGVKKPIFHIPLGLDKKKLNIIDKTKKIKSNIFYFGCISSFFRHKNQLIILESFQEIFKDNPNVGLILSGHAPTYDSYYFKVLEKIKEFNNPNIIINTKQLNDYEFANLLNKISVIVSVSTGEGYAYTPREAAACGIPTIIANNTAYNDLVKNNFYSIALDCPIKTPSFCILQNQVIGEGFLVEKDRLKDSFMNIIKNYDFYKRNAVRDKNKVRNLFSWLNIKEDILKILKISSFN